MDLQRQNQAWGGTKVAEVDEGLRAYMLHIYNYMASGLLLTGIVAWFTAHTPALLDLFYKIDETGRLVGINPLGYLVMFAPLIFVFALSFRIQSMSIKSAQAGFWGFAFVMGLSLANIFLIFTGASIARVFFITAITFGGMSLYGYSTKRDLTGMGHFMIMGVWGLMVGFIVNMFLKSGPFDLMLSAVGVLIFVGLTAWDTQRLKALYYQTAGMGEMAGKLAIMGALSLYLDFINLFMMLLRFFGDRR